MPARPEINPSLDADKSPRPTDGYSAPPTMETDPDTEWLNYVRVGPWPRFDEVQCLHKASETDNDEAEAIYD